MYKRIIFILMMMVITIPLYTSASSLTCEYKGSELGYVVSVHYKYGTPLTFSVNSTSMYQLKSIDLVNEDLVDNDGNISCPDVKISATAIDKQKWRLTFTKDLTANGSQVSGTIKDGAVYDDKEKTSSLSNKHVCIYRGNTESEYTLLWNENEVVVSLIGSRFKNYCGYKISDDFSRNDFKNNTCPVVYDTFVARAETSGSSCKGEVLISKNYILSQNDTPTYPSDIEDVDTGESVITTTPILPEPVDCKNLLTPETQELLKNIFKLAKYIGPALVAVLTIIDLIKASVSGDSDEMKKITSKFAKRIISAILLFFIPILVNILLDLFGITSADCTSIAFISIIKILK